MNSAIPLFRAFVAEGGRGGEGRRGEGRKDGGDKERKKGRREGRKRGRKEDARPREGREEGKLNTPNSFVFLGVYISASQFNM